MLQLDVAAIQHWINQFLWPFMRVSGFVMAAPILGTQVVPPRVRLLLALMITMAIAPTLTGLPTPDPLSPIGVVLVAQQLLIGVGLAFFLQVLLHAFVMSGQVVGVTMGLGFAAMNDPVNGVQVTVISQFFLMMATLLFLSMNGHLVMIEVLVESFHTMPVGAAVESGHLRALLGWGSWMFGAALLMALPAVTALLIINCSLGVITRAAPQLNIFAIGFPLMLVLGLFIMWANMASILPQFDRYSEEALVAMRAWVN
jgi:flagellar biosynthetic protein FliR